MRNNLLGKSLHCYSPRWLVCHEVFASNVGTTWWIAAGGGCGGGPVVEKRSLVRRSRNGEICRTWGGDQRDREWKISFQELDGLEGLDWEGLEGLEWLELDDLGWEGLEGLEWLEVVRLEFLGLEELDLELQKLQVIEKKTLHLTFLGWKAPRPAEEVWAWSLAGDELKRKWPGLSFLAYWRARGDLLDHVGRRRKKVGIHSSSWVPKRIGFTTSQRLWFGRRTVLKIQRSAKMWGKSKKAFGPFTGTAAFHTFSIILGLRRAKVKTRSEASHHTVWLTHWAPRPHQNMGSGCLSLWLWVMWARETQLQRLLVVLSVLHLYLYTYI